MRAAAFVRFPAADGLGHLGWAFDYSDARANAGAVEDPQGAMTVGPTAMGYWDEFLTNPVSAMTAMGYSALKYVDLQKANPVAAYRVAKWIGTQPYNLIGRNCLDDTYDVLRAYGVPELPLPSHELSPDLWFTHFSAAYAEVQGYEWTRSGKGGWRHRLALALTKYVPAKVPTWRRPRHRDGKNFEAQLKAKNLHPPRNQPRA